MQKQLVALQIRAAVVRTPARFFAPGQDVLKDKEKGDERIFFTKQDGK
jgi:hypothetical protein